jgi:hypothetical protein
MEVLAHEALCLQDLKSRPEAVAGHLKCLSELRIT